MGLEQYEMTGDFHWKERSFEFETCTKIRLGILLQTAIGDGYINLMLLCPGHALTRDIQNILSGIMSSFQINQ
ncbi:MAG TPA: hypothetical protein VMI12_16880 [Puia sp.]|nr:hypothetical protein [Puia sp.]